MNRSDRPFPSPIRLPKYSLHRATGQARVTLSGRDHYLGPHGSQESHGRYERLVAEWINAGRNAAMMPAARRDRSISVTELIAAYRVHSESYYVKDGRPTHTQHNIRCAMRRLRRLYGSTRAAEFGPSALKAVRQTWLDEGLSLRTINYKTGWVRHCFRWGVAEEMVPPSVIHALQAVPGLKAGRCSAPPPKKVPPVDDAVVEATLPHLPRVIADMVRVQRYIGCRPAEVCAMTMRELDTAGEVWVWRPRRHKTEHHGREKLYHIGPRAQAVLQRRVRVELDAPLFSPRESESERSERKRSTRKSPLTPSHRVRDATARDRAETRPRRPGCAYTSDSYRRAIQRATEKARLPKWSPHQLRHTRATEVRRSYGLDGAAAVIGNTLEAAEIYAERDAAVAREIALKTG